MVDKLSKELSLKQLFSYGFGSIIGVGWMTVLGYWLASAGPVGAMLAFFVGGGLILFIALCYGELAVDYPVAGAELTYLHEVFGLKAGFIVGWLMILNYTGVVIFVFVSLGWLLEALLPTLTGPVLYSFAGSDISLGGLLISLLCAVVIAYLNMKGAKGSGAFQQIVTYGLIAITVVFATLATINGSAENFEPLLGDIAPPSPLVGFFAILITTPFWFGGFNIIPQGMSEKKAESPAKAIRTVLIVAIVSSTIFYMVVVFAASIAMPREELLQAGLPVQAAVTAATGSEWGGRLVVIAGLCGLVTSWNAFVYGGSRMLFALGRAEVVFPFFGHLNEKSHTPRRAVLFITLLGIIGGLFGKAAILPIVDTGGIVFGLAYFLVCLALLKKRLSVSKGSGENRHLKLPIMGVVFSTFIIGSAIYFTFANSARLIPFEFMVLLIWLTIGVIGFVMGRNRKNILSSEERRARLLADL
ncbi:MAG: APC family permease [Pseudomonadota bacterium]